MFSIFVVCNMAFIFMTHLFFNPISHISSVKQTHVATSYSMGNKALDEDKRLGVLLTPLTSFFSTVVIPEASLEKPKALRQLENHTSQVR